MLACRCRCRNGRLVCGSAPAHAELEQALAAFKQTQAALTFSSGYACAVGSLRDAYSEHPQLLAVLPAMGYSDNQRRELKATIEASGAELVLNGSPADIADLLKLSLPTVPDFYQPLVKHPKVLKVVALSGGHSRDKANEILAQNHGIIASFSRALSEGLSAQQSDAEFDRVLQGAVDGIYAASIT